MGKLPIPFGNPATYAGHSGVDYPQRRGTVFKASGPGRVVSRGRNARGGFFVWVQYDAGPLVGYHHMDSHDGVPALGVRVAEGTQLGFVGSLGQFSTGPHLHSEVSGHATTDGYWRFFDPARVVGQPEAAGGGSSGSKPTPPVAVESEEDEMKFMYVDDDGNKRPVWVLLNVKTGKIVITYSQAQATSWTVPWGNAQRATRQQFLDAIDAIQKTS